MSTSPKSKVAAMRKAAKLTQVQLAKALGVAQSLVSACEAGKSSPAELLVKLGNFAADLRRYDDAVWFWKQAGVKVDRVVPAAMELLKSSDAPIVQGEITSIPASERWEHGANRRSRVRLETALLPTPIATSHVTIPNDSLLPMFKHGDVLVLDESDTDIWGMVGAYVAVLRHTAGIERVHGIREKMSDSEFAQYPELARRPDRLGLYVGWLRASGRGGSTVVTLEAPSALGGMSSEVVAFEINPTQGGNVRRRIEVPEFSVLGRVIAWVDMQGKSLSGEKEMSLLPGPPVKPPKGKKRRG